MVRVYRVPPSMMAFQVMPVSYTPEPGSMPRALDLVPKPEGV